MRVQTDAHPYFAELRSAFDALKQEHLAMELAPFDRKEHERHRAHLRAYIDALHRWQVQLDVPGKAPTGAPPDVGLD